MTGYGPARFGYAGDHAGLAHQGFLPTWALKILAYDITAYWHARCGKQIAAQRFCPAVSRIIALLANAYGVGTLNVGDWRF